MQQEGNWEEEHQEQEVEEEEKEEKNRTTIPSRSVTCIVYLVLACTD